MNFARANNFVAWKVLPLGAFVGLLEVHQPGQIQLFCSVFQVMASCVRVMDLNRKS